METDIYLYTTRTISADEIAEYCDINEMEQPAEDSENFYDIVYHLRDMDISDFFDNIKYSKWRDKYCLIVGTLGLWDGKHEIIPTLVQGIDNAISKCVGESDDCKIYVEDNTIKVAAYHHDGTNTFSVLILSSEGEEAYNNDEDEMDLDNPQYFIDVDYLF